jgi:ABC-type lipoprotein export system ATPase subunit
MNIVGCLDRATSGEFLLLDKDVSEASDDELAQIRREELGSSFKPSISLAESPF